MDDVLARVRARLAAGQPVTAAEIAELADALEAARAESAARWEAIGRLAPAAKALRMERDRLRRDAAAGLSAGASSRTVVAMADELPHPEPKEIDEKNAITLRHLAEDATLKGVPYGDEKCDNCLYYLDADAKIAYCWHPKLRILVGGQWWCQWWEKIE